MLLSSPSLSGSSGRDYLESEAPPATSVPQTSEAPTAVMESVEGIVVGSSLW